MNKKYKVVRIPIEAYLKEKAKVEQINIRLKELIKNKRNVKMTQYFNFRAGRPLFIYDDELVNFFGKSKRRYSLL